MMKVCVCVCVFNAPCYVKYQLLFWKVRRKETSVLVMGLLCLFVSFGILAASFVGLMAK